MSNSLLLYVGYRLIDFFIDALERITIISPPNGEILQQISEEFAFVFTHKQINRQARTATTTTCHIYYISR